MPDQDGPAPDLRSLLAAVEAAAPVAAVDVFAAELGKQVGAEAVAFLISDFNGSSLVRFSQHPGGGGHHRSQGSDAAETVPLAGTTYEQVVRAQRLQVRSGAEGARVVAPVTARGDVIGVLEMLLPADPDADTVDYIAAAAHALGYVVIVNRRFTDLFEWGQRSQPFSLAAEIQRRLLPTSLTCEAGQFTVAGAVEPAGNVGGDTFDYILDRDTLHVSLTDAMGHEEEAALLATLLVGSLRNSRRAGVPLAEQAARANSALLQHARPDQFVTGQLLRVDLTAGTAAMVNAGHPRPLRLRDGRVEEIVLAADPPFGIVPGLGYRVQPVTLLPGDRMVFVTDGVLDRNAATAGIIGLIAVTGDLHPREVVQEITRAVLRAVNGRLRDDATALCLDWYGGGERDRQVDAGANRAGASPPQADSGPGNAYSAGFPARHDGAGAG
jgi:stage II sporulation SpoE-like protein